MPDTIKSHEEAIEHCLKVIKREGDKVGALVDLDALRTLMENWGIRFAIDGLRITMESSGKLKEWWAIRMKEEEAKE